MTLWLNIIAGVYFGMFQIPHIGTRWTNYILSVASLSGLVLIMLVKETYKRSKIDG